MSEPLTVEKFYVPSHVPHFQPTSPLTRGDLPRTGQPCNGQPGTVQPCNDLPRRPGARRPARTAGLAAAVTAAVAAAMLLGACATTSLPASPQYQRSTSATEAEYQSYLIAGQHTLEGQALQRLPDGRRVPVAGRSVTLDPATSTGNDWWRVAGRSYGDRFSQPPSEAFARARRVAITDGEGRFTFRNLPAGSYLVRTDFGGTSPNAPKGLLGRRIAVPTTGPIVLDDLAN